MTAITIGTRRTTGGHNGRDYRYIGVLRHGTTILAECGHEHANRDRGGDSATDCITLAVRLTALPVEARHMTADRFRNEWLRLTRGGFQQTAETIAKAKVDSHAKAEAYLALVDELTALFAQHNVTVNVNGLGARLTCAA